MPMSTQSLRRCSNGSSMPSPTETPPASRRAPVGRLHRARAAAGDHRVAGVGQRRAERDRRPRTPGCPGGVRAEPKTDDRARQLGQQPEALDELGLDPQHPPRVGVHPVRRARGSRAAAGRWCPAGLRRGAARPGRAGARRRPVRRASRAHARVLIADRASSVSVRNADQGRLDCARSAPPRRTPRGCARGSGRPGRSSPPGCRARRTGPRRSSRTWPAARPPTAATNACGQRARPARAARAGAESTSSTLEAGEHLAHVRQRLGLGPVRREAVVDRRPRTRPGRRCRRRRRRCRPR